MTIGGGVVLDATPIPRMPGQVEFLRVLAGGNAESVLRIRIARRKNNGVAVSQLVTETGWTRNFIETQLAGALNDGRILRIEDLLIDTPAVSGLQLLMMSAVKDFQKKNPLVAGIAKEQLRDQVTASAEVFAAAVAMLVRDKKIEVIGDVVRLPGQGVVMKDEEAESKKKIESAFMTAGLNVPALHQVIAGLKIDKVRAQKIVTLLLRDKVLVKISDELVFHRSALEELRRQVAAYKIKAPIIDVGKFKELTGVSRKYAIPLLEFLDRERVTKRVGDSRQIL